MSHQSTAPRVLVLLAAFNGAPWIEEQLDSILAQEDVDVHVVVGDDASTDGTRELVLKYAASRITLMTRVRSTGSAGQNFFAMIRDVDATGFDFVAFSDQDDVWRGTKLSRAVRLLHYKGHIGYASNTTAVWPNGKERTLRQSPAITRSDFLFEGAGQGCTYVLARAFYDRARLFLLEHQTLTAHCHYHDWPLYALARVWDLAWAFDSESTIRYRQHHQNDTGAKLSLGGMLRRVTGLANGWYSRQLASVYRLAEAADPAHPVIAEWGSLLLGRASLKRRLQIARFCVKGGRRKPSDKMVLIAAALIGWI